jgi:hypothetical protein
MEPNSNYTFINFDELQAKADWDAEDVIWILFGDYGLTAINSFRSNVPHEERGHPDYRVTSLYDNFLKDISSGRLGKVSNDHGKDALRFYAVHPLKVIDWIDDEKNLGRLDLYDDFKPHPKFNELIKSWNSDRESEDQPMEWGGINLEELPKHLAKEDFWGRGEFRRLLFAQTYAHEYPLSIYHKYIPEIEAMMREVDHRIEEGLEAGRIRLTDSGLVFGNDLLAEIRFKGYPVPDGLIEAGERGDWLVAERLLKDLRERMKEFVLNEGRPLPRTKESMPTLNAEAETFIRSLKIGSVNEVEIIIQQPGKKSVAYPSSTLGFFSCNTKEWKGLLGILKSGNFQHASSNRSAKEKFKRIEKKLITFFTRQFSLAIGSDFKIFALSPGNEGVRAPIFQILTRAIDRDFDYSSLNREETEEELKQLCLSDDVETAGQFKALTEHAKSIGMTDSDIELIIDVEGEFRDRDVVDPYENTLDDPTE